MDGEGDRVLVNAGTAKVVEVVDVEEDGAREGNNNSIIFRSEIAEAGVEGNRGSEDVSSGGGEGNVPFSVRAVEQGTEPAVGGGEDHLVDQKNRRGGYEEREEERKEREETEDGGARLNRVVFPKQQNCEPHPDRHCFLSF